MKRRLIAFLIITVTSSAGYTGLAQNLGSSDDDLHLKALRAYLESASARYANLRTARDYKNLIIEKDERITSSLPTRIGSCQVSFRDISELFPQFKKEKQSIPITRIHPIKSRGSSLVIRFTEHWLSFRKKNRIEIALEGGCEIELKFDCSTQAFLIGEIKFWGI
jgi:hypothetical protein